MIATAGFDPGALESYKTSHLPGASSSSPPFYLRLSTFHSEFNLPPRLKEKRYPYWFWISPGFERYRPPVSSTTAFSGPAPLDLVLPISWRPRPRRLRPRPRPSRMVPPTTFPSGVRSTIFASLVSLPPSHQCYFAPFLRAKAYSHLQTRTKADPHVSVI